MNRITYPREVCVEDLRRLRQDPGRRLTLPATLHFPGGDVNLLILPDRSISTRGRHKSIQVGLGEGRSEGVLTAAQPSEVLAVLRFGVGARENQVQGWLQMEPGRIEPVDELLLVGPGMTRIPLRGGFAGHSIHSSESEWEERCSRTIAALGKDVWGRLVGLRIMMVGAGRVASTLTLQLARMGVRHLVVADPDRIELHNLGESLPFTREDVGQFKVEALARRIRFETGASVEPLTSSITSTGALRALAESDFVCCAVDHNSARITAVQLAALYFKPLLDIGTGIQHQGGRRQTAADIRLVWSGRCLECTGGFRNMDEARQVLTSSDSARLLRLHPGDWRSQRAGSLASLNTLAVGAGLRMVEDFVAGRLRQNGTWLHLEYSERGELSASYPLTNRTLSGALLRCACRLSGLGDEGLGEMVEDLKSASADTT